MWMIPSQFGDSLESFAKAFAKKDDDGVFRYEPGQIDPQAQELASQDDTDQWFETSSDPEIAKAVAEARAVANKPVDSTLDDPKELPTFEPPAEQPVEPFTEQPPQL